MPDFLATLDQMREIHRKKNEDYANTANPLSNFDISSYVLALFNHPRDQTFASLIGTKLGRLSSLLQSQRDPNNESVSDSLVDIANYCILWKCDIERRAVKDKDWIHESNNEERQATRDLRDIVEELENQKKRMEE